ncbi:MAG: winged helix-turn-helix transcriptional regulator [Balneolaceae bacterium]|nr:winged helix-turn-helix transcriptional regulator [Balneolaceae bacterium]
MTTKEEFSDFNQHSELPVPNEKLGFLFWQLNMHWVRHVNKIVGDYDLTHTQLITLVATRWLRQNQDEVIQQDLVDLIKIDRMLVSKMVKKNVEAGFLVKQFSERDCRVNVLELTEQGHQKLKEIVPVMIKAEQEFFGSLGDQRKELTNRLQTLLSNIEEAVNAENNNNSHS